jgi:hypothetical protein
VRKKAVLAVCWPEITLTHRERRRGMFCVSIAYPKKEGGTFDFDYYIKKHIPMVTGFTNINPIIQVDEVVAGI